MPNGKPFGVAIVGSGRFGRKRAHAVAANPHSKLRVAADVAAESARNLGEEMGCAYTTNWKDAISREDVDVVIVSTSTHMLPQVARAALEEGKHVLCEKPFGRSAQEVLPAVEAAERNNLCLKVGYNHRYHPALEKAHAIFQSSRIGRLQFLRCVYGHGGREGYEREWRAQADLSGGGQLLDQGVHALDLFRWFAGEFTEVKALASTAFWPIAPLEDNIFVLLRTDGGCVASLHASWTQWKNTFTLEVFGEEGYLTVFGLGGHYGAERLCYGKRQELGARPDEEHFEFSGSDQSLDREWADFLNCIEQGRLPQSSGRDAWQTLRLAESIYRSAGEHGASPSEIAHEPSLFAQAHYAGENTR